MTNGIVLKPIFLDSVVFFMLKNIEACISIEVLDFNKIYPKTIVI